ncbi:MAG: site-specific integrase [Thermoanaerobaculales bacterium]
MEQPRQPRREMRALGKEEAARFLEALHGTEHEALFVLALATGMRPGEYLGLGWKDVDLEKGTVTIQRTLVQIKGKWGLRTSVGTKERWSFGEPKTSRGRRTLPIPASVVDLLLQHRVHQLEQRLQVANVWEDHDLVFANEIGQPINRYNLVNRHFKPLVRKAGLAPTLRLYDLRHSAATLLLAAGIHPKVASERLGHASIVMTLDTYSHVLPDMQKEASDKMEELLFGNHA